jgi:hypothetical protein
MRSTEIPSSDEKKEYVNQNLATANCDAHVDVRLLQDPGHCRTLRPDQSLARCSDVWSEKNNYYDNNYDNNYQEELPSTMMS